MARAPKTHTHTHTPTSFALFFPFYVLQPMAIAGHHAQTPFALLGTEPMIKHEYFLLAQIGEN